MSSLLAWRGDADTGRSFPAGATTAVAIETVVPALIGFFAGDLAGAGILEGIAAARCTMDCWHLVVVVAAFLPAAAAAAADLETALGDALGDCLAAATESAVCLPARRGDASGAASACVGSADFASFAAMTVPAAAAGWLVASVDM